jgi:hypothetical protein
MGLIIVAAVAVALLASGCGSQLRSIRSEYEKKNPKPPWIDKPPADQYVGVSQCSSEATAQPVADMGRTFFRDSAYRDALVKKCKVGKNDHKQNLPETVLISPAEEYLYPCQKGGMMMYGLFKNEDLDCSRIER